MKLRTLGASVLIAAIAAGVLLPSAASAGPIAGSATQYESEGSITYTGGDGGETGNVTDPEEGEEIDEPDPNPTLGELMIIGATDYEFVNADGSTAQTTAALATYNALPFGTTKTADGSDILTRHFVEFRDLRGSDEVYASRQYKISAAITTPFTRSTGETLNGAKLIYNDVSFQSQVGQSYDTGVAGTDYTIAKSGTIDLSQTGNAAGPSQDFLTVDTSDDTAMGRFHLLFGATRPTTTTASDDGVQLEVPANQNMRQGTYSAVVTWTISETIA
ncbi:WxL domain-containing protein [Enterococcus sp. LJL120]